MKSELNESDCIPRLRQRTDVKTIEEFLNGLEYLPPLPRHLAELGKLLGQPDAGLDQVVEIIRYDPALAAQVIRLCNSASLGYSTPVGDVQEAALRLGFDKIMQLATALGAAALLHSPRQGCSSATRELWKHSVASALLGKVIALDRSESPSLVFTTCLLHDVGKMVLYRNPDLDYAEVVSEARSKQIPVRAAEGALLGFDHAQVGASLLQKWRFPSIMVEAVRCHHAPAQARENRPLAAYTCLANHLAWFMDFGATLRVLDLSGRSEALELTGLEEEKIPHLMTRAYAASREVTALLELPLAT